MSDSLNTYNFLRTKNKQLQEGSFEEYLPSIPLQPYITRYYFLKGFSGLNSYSFTPIGKENVLGSSIKKLYEQILDSFSNTDIITRVERFFIFNSKKNKKQGKDISQISNFIQHINLGRIDKICSELTISRRKIERLFNNYIGLSPKQYINTNRFNKACETISSNPNVKLCEMSLDCSYYDQSHFTSEFKLITKKVQPGYCLKIIVFIS